MQQRELSDELYDIVRAASVKEFEIVPEQSGKLLTKRLRPYFASNQQADKLTFKNVFRHAVKLDLINGGRFASAGWPIGVNRNETAHDYGVEFAETTLKLLPSTH